jgi:hypothetical protein
MAEKEKLGELCGISLCKAENGWKICCTYEDSEMTVSKRAGWVPCQMQSKDYVEKTKAAVLKRLEEVM